MWLFAVALLTALLGLWMDLSPTHRYHNGDSVLQILVSLDRWTPFFWEQNRFGMLVPLLALPIHHPFHNLLFEVWLRFLALVSSFFLLARAVVPRRFWPAVGGASLGIFLAAKSVAHLTYLHTQPYFQALALALGGVLLFEAGGGRAPRTRRTAGAVLVALAFWTSPCTLFWLLPLLWMRRILGLEPRAEGWRFWPRRADLRRPEGLRAMSPFLLIGACFAASLAASAVYGLLAYGGTEPGPAPVADWPLAWRSLAAGFLRYLPGGWAAALLLLLALAALLTLAGRTRERPALAAGLCLVAAAAAEIAALGTIGWVHRQSCDIRFLATGLTAAIVAGPAVLLSLLLEGRPAAWQRAANGLALAALVPLTLYRFGPPSLARARAALDAGVGVHSAEVLAGGATHVLGNYWRVWPAVFHTDLLLFERGETRRVWGITYRSRPTRRLWQLADWRRARFALLGAAGEVDGYRERYGIPPLFLKADLGHVGIASVVPPPAAISAERRRPPPPVIAAGSALPGAPGQPLDFYTLRPCMLLDTLKGEPLLSGAPPLRIDVAGAACGVPPGARAVAVNAQAILPPSAGWVALFPSDHPSPLPTLSFPEGDTVAHFGVVPLSPHGALAMTAGVADGGDVHVILDVSGYFLRAGRR